MNAQLDLLSPAHEAERVRRELMSIIPCERGITDCDRATIVVPADQVSWMADLEPPHYPGHVCLCQRCWDRYQLREAERAESHARVAARAAAEEQRTHGLQLIQCCAPECRQHEWVDPEREWEPWPDLDPTAWSRIDPKAEAKRDPACKDHWCLIARFKRTKRDKHVYLCSDQCWHRVAFAFRADDHGMPVGMLSRTLTAALIVLAGGSPQRRSQAADRWNVDTAWLDTYPPPRLPAGSLQTNTVLCSTAAQRELRAELDIYELEPGTAVRYRAAHVMRMYPGEAYSHPLHQRVGAVAEYQGRWALVRWSDGADQLIAHEAIERILPEAA